MGAELRVRLIRQTRGHAWTANSREYRSALNPVSATRVRIPAARFAQKNFSILLDTHILGEQARGKVSSFEARLPLRSPRAVSLTVKLCFERREDSTSSAPFSPLPRDLTYCPIQRTARPRPQRFHATTLDRARLASCEDRFCFSQRGEH